MNLADLNIFDIDEAIGHFHRIPWLLLTRNMDCFDNFYLHFDLISGIIIMLNYNNHNANPSLCLFSFQFPFSPIYAWLWSYPIIKFKVKSDRIFNEIVKNTNHLTHTYKRSFRILKLKKIWIWNTVLFKIIYPFGNTMAFPSIGLLRKHFGISWCS